ncbi:MAG TPA: shikimate dehydrogenase [Cytophagaceae bacterium]|jgi:shikimate dehydrogenase|nr:shikimate dehydrogenase [Cytophagaceae bacterium]
MNLYGLIGFPLTHSFSKKYFTEKFEKENIKDSKYELFEIKEAGEILEVLKNNPDLRGLNVTIPHKENIMKYLTHFESEANDIGAVNVIRVLPNGDLEGWNSDYYGFRESLARFMGASVYNNHKALVLGTGGASKAIVRALKDYNFEYTFVSRRKDINNSYLYEELNETILSEYKLIINTSPLGMYPKTESFPEIPYQYLTPEHFLFDLVYNPEETTFMKKGAERGAKTKNGLEMLHLQAEKAWEIWNS